MDAKDDVITGTADTSPVPGAEALNSASQALFERHQAETPNANPALDSALNSANQALGVDPAVALANRSAVRGALVRGLRTLDGVVQRRLRSACQRLATSMDFQTGLLAEAALPEDVATEIAELILVLCDKYGVSIRFAPELALGSYGVGIVFAVLKLRDMGTDAKAAPLN